MTPPTKRSLLHSHDMNIHETARRACAARGGGDKITLLVHSRTSPQRREANVVMTHSHFDSIHAAPAFARAMGIGCAMGGDSLSMLRFVVATHKLA